MSFCLKHLRSTRASATALGAPKTIPSPNYPKPTQTSHASAISPKLAASASGRIKGYLGVGLGWSGSGRLSGITTGGAQSGSFSSDGKMGPPRINNWAATIARWAFRDGLSREPPAYFQVDTVLEIKKEWGAILKLKPKTNLTASHWPRAEKLL